MAFNPKKFLDEEENPLNSQGHFAFKDPEVEEEFGGIKQHLHDVAASSPDVLPISSAYRNEEANRLAGGVPNSYHKSGDSLDIRKRGDQSRNLNHFKEAGYKILDEGDHFHVEPTKNIKSSFNPKEFLDEEESPLSPESVSPTEGVGDMYDNPLDSYKAMGRSALSSATAGLSEPVSAGIAAPIASLLIKNNPDLAALPEEQKDIGNIYGRMRERETGEMKRLKEEFPFESLAGDVAGIMAPGGAFSQIDKLVGKGVKAVLPEAKTIMEMVGAGAEEAPFAARMASEIPGEAAKLGTANYLYNAADPEKEAGAGDFLGGAAFGAALPPAREGIELAYKTLPKTIGRFVSDLPGIKGILDGMGKEREAVASKAFGEKEAVRRSAYDVEKEAAKEGLSGITKKEPVTSAEDLQTMVKQENINLGKKYQEDVGPIVKQYGKEKISPEKLRVHINSFLDESGFLDDKGNILANKIKSIQAPELKSFVSNLNNFSKRLAKNPTVKELKMIENELSSLANFGASSRGAEQKIYGKLSHTAKENILEGLESISDSSVADKIRKAREAYATGRPVLDELSDIVDKHPESIISGAKTKLPPTFEKKVSSRFPGMKGSIADIVGGNIVRRGKTPSSLDNIIKEYGEDYLKNLLGEEAFNKLISAKSRFAESSKPFIPGQMQVPPGGLESFFSKLLGGIKPIAGRVGNQLAKGTVPAASDFYGTIMSGQ